MDEGHRWGDAPLRAMVLGIFATPSTVLRLDEFDYLHPNVDYNYQKGVCLRNDFTFHPVFVCRTFGCHIYASAEQAAEWRQIVAKGECLLVSTHLQASLFVYPSRGPPASNQELHTVWLVQNWEM